MVVVVVIIGCRLSSGKRIGQVLQVNASRLALARQHEREGDEARIIRLEIPTRACPLGLNTKIRVLASILIHNNQRVVNSSNFCSLFFAIVCEFDSKDECCFSRGNSCPGSCFVETASSKRQRRDEQTETTCKAEQDNSMAVESPPGVVSGLSS